MVEHEVPEGARPQESAPVCQDYDLYMVLKKKTPQKMGGTRKGFFGNYSPHFPLTPKQTVSE